MNSNIIDCLNESTAIAEITLQGSKALEIYDTLSAQLVEEVNVRIQDSNYFLTCLNPWCKAKNVTNDVTPAYSEAPLESNDEIKIKIMIIILFFLIILILLTCVTIKCYQKTNVNTKKHRIFFKATSHPTTKDKHQQHFALKNLMQTV